MDVVCIYASVYACMHGRVFVCIHACVYVYLGEFLSILFVVCKQSASFCSELAILTDLPMVCLTANYLHK